MNYHYEVIECYFRLKVVYAVYFFHKISAVNNAMSITLGCAGDLNATSCILNSWCFPFLSGSYLFV